MTYPGNPGNPPGQYPPGFQPQYQAQPAAPPAGQWQQPPPLQAPQAPAAPQQPQFADLNARIPSGSPDWPQELWGKPLREGIRYYNIAMEDFKRRNLPQQPRLQGEPQQGQPQPQPRPQAQPPQYQPPQPSQAFDANSVAQMVREAVQSAMAPMQQVTADAILQKVRSKYPDWHIYHQRVLELVGPALQAQPELALQESTWETAFFVARGERPQNNGGGVGMGGGYQGGGYLGGQDYGSRGEIRTPPPPPPGTQPYFAEAPSISPVGGNNIAALTNDPQIISMARRFGIPVDEYIRWMNGNVPPQGA